MGSSLERERRSFTQQVLVQQWVGQQVNRTDEEITHLQMLEWYQSHLKDFETPPRVRWEELMVRTANHPSRADAYAALARMGNQVAAGARAGRGRPPPIGGYYRHGRRIPRLDQQGEPGGRGCRLRFVHPSLAATQPDPGKQQRLSHCPRVGASGHQQQPVTGRAGQDQNQNSPAANRQANPGTTSNACGSRFPSGRSSTNRPNSSLAAAKPNGTGVPLRRRPRQPGQFR